MNHLVSVIICTYNRCEDLGRVLDSLLKQRTNNHFTYEAIIVDNNSTDQTKEVVSKYQTQFQEKLKYLLESKQGKSYALNLGIKTAQGDILCFTDDDVILDEFWLEKIVECYDQHACDGVGGRVLPVFPSDTPAWVRDNAVKLSGAVVIYDHGDTTVPLHNSMYRFIGANYSFKRSIFKQLGDFRTDLGPGKGTVGEDVELVDRFLDNGKILYYCGEALVWHPFDMKRLTLKHVAKWNIELGTFKVRKEIEKKEAFIFYFGIPRYLIRGIMRDFLRLITVCYNRPAFFIAWRDLFCKAGMIREYKKIDHKRKFGHA